MKRLLQLCSTSPQPEPRTRPTLGGIQTQVLPEQELCSTAWNKLLAQLHTLVIQTLERLRR